MVEWLLGTGRSDIGSPFQVAGPATKKAECCLMEVRERGQNDPLAHMNGQSQCGTPTKGGAVKCFFKNVFAHSSYVVF